MQSCPLIKRFALLVLLLLAAPAAWAGPQAGVAAAVRGSVRLDRTGLVGLDVRSGTPILLGDKIVTAQDSGLQILLLDETVFTLGPQSEMTIDEFVYDPTHPNGAIDAQMLKGTFRFISGKVAKQKPDQMKVRTPAGTIGIRGTMVLARIDAATGASLIVLGGPGARNNTGDKRGSIWVENAGERRDVLQAGWGVEIPAPDAPPSEPFRVPDTSLAQFRFEPDPPAPGEEQKTGEPSESAPDSSQSSEGEGAPEGQPKPPGPPREDGSPPPSGELGAAEETSGQRAAGDSELGGVHADLGGRLGRLEGFTANSAQAILGQAVAITSVNQLVQHSGVFNGHFHYIRNGVPLINGDGSFNLFLDLDFSNDVVAMQVQNLTSLLVMQTNLNSGGSVPFNTGLNGFADYHIVDPTPSGVTPCNGSPGACEVHVFVKFRNANGQLAGVSDSQVILKNGTIETRGGVPDLPVTNIVP